MTCSIICNTTLFLIAVTRTHLVAVTGHVLMCGWLFNGEQADMSGKGAQSVSSISDTKPKSVNQSLTAPLSADVASNGTTSPSPPPARAASQRAWNELSTLTMHSHPDEAIGAGVEFRIFTEDREGLTSNLLVLTNGQLQFPVGVACAANNNTGPEWWRPAYSLVFQTPAIKKGSHLHQPWSVATYEGCQRPTFQAESHPCMNVTGAGSGSGGGNPQIAGKFIVTHILSFPPTVEICVFHIRFYQYDPTITPRRGVWGDLRFVNWKLYEPVLKELRTGIERRLKSIPAIAGCSDLAIHIITEYAAEVDDAVKMTPAELRSGFD